MSWINSCKAAAVIITSSIFSFFIVEYSYRYIQPHSLKVDFTERTMLFEVGNNFKNYDGFFKYYPNEEIRSTTIYSKINPKSIEDLIIEYDYQISTNNLGLVMREDVYSNDRVILVIGDSFTEGQGASPWFYDLERENSIDNTKIVNLGILGTGPEQWENLASSVSRELQLNVNATIINIIPADLERAVWTFKDRELDCLYRADCNYKYGFQGYKFSAHENYDDIKSSVLSSLAKTEAEAKSFKLFEFIKNIMKRSNVIVDIYRYMSTDNSDQIEINTAALLRLKQASGGNFYVNIVSQKNLNSSNLTRSKTALQLIEFLKKNQIMYTWCDIPPAGYHKYDRHPNSEGYKVLRKCTEDALNILNNRITKGNE